MSRTKKLLIGLPLIVLGAVFLMGASGCSKHAVAKSDETVCVYDGSTNGAQKLKYQLFPGQNPRNTDGNDEIVHIPASYRFYAAFKNRSIADAGAPYFYLGYAKGNTPLQVQGTVRFKFNLDNACEWYARHGRRNTQGGTLGFNARSSGSASALSPWVKWLNENFGTVMEQTIKSNTIDFTWPELVYGNDSESGITRKQPVDIAYGKYIGKLFTQRLEKSLGGKFFCGTDVSIWDADEVTDPACPPIFFDTGPIVTADRQLMVERGKTERLRAQLQNAEQEAKIREAQVGAQKRDERTKQEVLTEQLITAKLQAEASVGVQKCIIFAKLGLDCDGHRPNLVIAGSTTK